MIYKMYTFKSLYQYTRVHIVDSTAYIFDGRLTMDEEWSDDLLDKNSAMYQNISRMLSTQVGTTRQMDYHHDTRFFIREVR